MRVTEMTFSRGVDIGENAGWVTREFTDDVKVSATARVAPGEPVTWDDVVTMYRKLTPEAYR